MEYLKTYKNEHFDPITNRSIFMKMLKNFFGELYHYNIRENVRDKTYIIFNFLQSSKSSFKEGFLCILWQPLLKTKNKCLFKTK